MKKYALIFLGIFLLSITFCWGQNSISIENKIYYVKKLDNLAINNYKTKYPNGKTKEIYIKNEKGTEYLSYFSNGKVYEHYIHKITGITHYERFYPSGLIAERFFQDDRTTTYNTFWPNGQIKEHYTYNKKQNKKEYYKYNSKGKLIKI